MLQGCLCKHIPCQQVGFHILTSTMHMIHIYAHDRYPQEYLILMYLHPGINTIAWCSSTLFTHRGQKRLPQAALRIASTDKHLSTKVWEYSPSMQFLPTGDKHILPHALDEVEEGAELPNIPIMVTILPPVPSLSNLCRLAMGITGVTKDGIIDLPPSCFDIKSWGMYKAVLGHDTSPK